MTKPFILRCKVYGNCSFKAFSYPLFVHHYNNILIILHQPASNFSQSILQHHYRIPQSQSTFNNAVAHTLGNVLSEVHRLKLHVSFNDWRIYLLEDQVYKAGILKENFCHEQEQMKQKLSKLQSEMLLLQTKSTFSSTVPLKGKSISTNFVTIT